MADQQMPEHRAKPFGVRRDTLGGDDRNQDAESSGLASESAIAAHDAEDVSPGGGRGFQSPHDVHRDILFAVAAAYRKDQHGVAGADARSLQPGGEAGLPALVVGARGKFGNVVGGRVSFKAAQLAKIVYSVAGVSGGTADAQNEQPPAYFADVGQGCGHALDLSNVDVLEDGDGFGNECRG